MSQKTANSGGKRRQIITEFRSIARFSRRQECLTESTCRIYLKTVLANVPTRSPSIKAWEYTQEIGLILSIITRNLDKILGKSSKVLKNQNIILYSIANNSGSFREMNSIKNIKANASKKRRYSRSKYSRIGLDSNSSLSIDSCQNKTLRQAVICRR